MGDPERGPASAEDAYYDRRWRDLERLDSTIDHWFWRPGWHIGRSHYTWHVTFDADSPVRALAAAYQAAVDLPFLDRVPLAGLHLTVQGVGFTDEVPRTELDAVVSAAGEALAAIPGFTLALGPADADEQGVPLAVRPFAPITAVRHALRRAIGAVRGPGPAARAPAGAARHAAGAGRRHAPEPDRAQPRPRGLHLGDGRVRAARPGLTGGVAVEADPTRNRCAGVRSGVHPAVGPPAARRCTAAPASIR